MSFEPGVVDFVPQGTRVLIQEIEEEMTEGGVILTTGDPNREGDDNTDSYRKGVVVAVGPGTWLANGEIGSSQFQEGDVIYFLRGLRPVALPGDKHSYLVVEENQVLGRALRLEEKDHGTEE